MAKTKKKSGGSTGGSAQSKSSGKKPASPGDSMINTDLAAQAAAKALMNRAILGNPAPAVAADSDAGQAHPPTSTFKHLTEAMHKPATGGLSQQLPAGSTDRKSMPGFGAGKQTGRDQTTGHFNRAGVPRRTPG